MFVIVARLSRARADDAAQVALDQRDAGALHRDVRAGAHRDADVGLRQRGRVVDAVAGHRDDAPLRLQRSARRRLLLRQHLRFDLVDAELPGHRLGRLRLSPVSMTIRCPRPSAPHGLGVVPLTGSATPMITGESAVHGQNMTVWPAPRSSAHVAATAAVDPRIVHERRFPSTTARPSTLPSRLCR